MKTYLLGWVAILGMNQKTLSEKSDVVSMLGMQQRKSNFVKVFPEVNAMLE